MWNAQSASLGSPAPVRDFGVVTLLWEGGGGWHLCRTLLAQFGVCVCVVICQKICRPKVVWARNVILSLVIFVKWVCYGGGNKGKARGPWPWPCSHLKCGGFWTFFVTHSPISSLFSIWTQFLHLDTEPHLQD